MTPEHHHQMIAAAALAAGDTIYEWDLATDRITWAPGAERLFAAGSTDAFATGEMYGGRVNPEDLPLRLKLLADHYGSRETFDCEYRIRQADGQFCWVHDRGAAEFDEAGRPMRMRGVLRLVNRRKQYEARLEHIANFDELTGHFNRSRLRDTLHQEIVHGQRYDVAGAYMSVGIDKLALINDAFGYLTADAVIVAVGQRLERVVRASDVIGRMGGDVFGIVLSHCPEAEMATVAEKILRSFRERPIQTPSGPVSVSVSIGGVAFPTFVQTAYEAVARAEAAMREAKLLGRDCFSAYRMTDEQRRDHRRSMAIGEEVKLAMKDDRIAFAFQPIVAAGGHSVEMYECLLRMRSPEGEIVPAYRFVPVIETLGLTRIMDRRVLELAVRELTESPDVTLAINISALTPADHSWLRSLVALVGHRPDLARRLVIEITETAAIQDIEETARFVATVRELGCRVALDDFGAGYTSFRHLKALTVDIIKIDGSFVTDIAASPDNRAFVRTLVGLAQNLGLQTVAECVETASDAQILNEEGVHSLQGYFFAKPTLERPWLGSGAEALAIAREQLAQPLPQAAAG